MMKRATWLPCVIVLASVGSAFAQNTDDNLPPNISIFDWTVVHFDGVSDTVFTAGVTGTLADIEDYLHTERDIIFVTFLVRDPDWLEPGFDPTMNTDQSIFIGARACSSNTSNCSFGSLFGFNCIPFFANTSPVAPVMSRDLVFDDSKLFGATNDTGFAPSGTPLSVFVTVTFQVPDFIGANQARLRGEIDFDIMYSISFIAANEKTPTEFTSVGFDCIPIKVVENPVFSPPSSPAFADAGGDQTVAINQLAVLDGSRTFDSNNLGFDVNDPNVIEKDVIRFTWEWISGPVRVDPEQANENDPTAQVTFATPGTYVYRLTATDTTTSLASTDTVTITVLQQLPNLLAPVAVILGPSSATVGATITLDGRQSSDPNGDTLTYRWTQTNALGGPLTSTLSGADIADVFQPLSGATSSVATWQAVAAGDFYFRLSVSDGTFTTTTPVFTIRVTELADSSGGGGTSTGGNGNSNGSSDDGGTSTPTTTCGLGALTPLALLPLLLVSRRRR